jgi:hypothetical protein
MGSDKILLFNVWSIKRALLYVNGKLATEQPAKNVGSFADDCVRALSGPTQKRTISVQGMKENEKKGRFRYGSGH